MLAPHLACRTVTVRPALVYGPGQSSSFFVPSLIEHCLSGRDFTIRTPDHVRDLLHVDDLVDALLLLLDVALPSGDVLNIGSGRGVAMRDVAASIVRLSGSSIRLLEGTPPPDGGIPHLCLNREKASAVLGWSPRIGLEEGLSRTIDAYRRLS
jgi:nucleoside-diphosphate-sugar epimerase